MKTWEIISGTVAGLFAGSFRLGEKSHGAGRLCWAGGILLGLAGASSAQANLVTNGNFETNTGTPSAPVFTAWTFSADTGPALNGTPALDGAYSAGVGVGNLLYQSVGAGNTIAGGGTFSLTYELAVTDPTGTNRNAGFLLDTVEGGGSANLGLISLYVGDGSTSGDGAIEVTISSGGTTTTKNKVVDNSVEFSTAAEIAGTSGSPNVNTITVSGIWGGAYSISVTNSALGTNTATGLQDYQTTSGNAPTTSSIGALTFADIYQNLSGYSGSAIFDDVDLENTLATPEPASVGLFAAIAGIGLLKRRRAARPTAAC